MSHPAHNPAANAGAGGQPEGTGDTAGRIVVDASGGDSPLGERLAGALDAARTYPDTQIILCGEADRIDPEVDRHGPRPDNVTKGGL